MEYSSLDECHQNNTGIFCWLLAPQRCFYKLKLLYLLLILLEMTLMIIDKENNSFLDKEIIVDHIAVSIVLETH